MSAARHALAPSLTAATVLGLFLTLAPAPARAQTATLQGGELAPAPRPRARPPAPNPDILPPGVAHFPRGVRIALELATTNLVGAAGSAAGYYIAFGFSQCPAARDSSGCNTAIAIGLGVGGALGGFLGASAGYLMDGDGRAWATLLGAAIGAVPLTTGVMLGVSGPALLLLLPTPYLGAMLGFELTSRDYVGAPERPRAFRWMPGFVPTPGGGCATFNAVF